MRKLTSEKQKKISSAKKKLYRIGYRANATKQTFFFANEQFFDAKLYHFIVNSFFPLAKKTNTQA